MSTQEPASRWAPWAPAVGLVALYGLYRQVYDRIAVEALDLSFPAAAWRALPGPEAAVTHLEARLTWGLAVLAFCLAFLAAAYFCLRAVWEGTPAERRWLMTVGAAAMSSAGIAVGLAGNPMTLPQLAGVLEAGFTRMEMPDGRFLLYFFNGLGITIALLLTFAASATLFEPEIVKGEGTAEDDARTLGLRDQSRRLHRVLYAGAAVLIAGSAQAAALHRLPVAYLNEPWSLALESAAQSAAVMIGTLWTLFLVAIYLPAAWILRERFLRQAEKALPKADDAARRTWLAEHGLDLSVSQQIKRLAAVLGPLLTSVPLVGLFDLLAG